MAFSTFIGCKFLWSISGPMFSECFLTFSFLSDLQVISRRLVTGCICEIWETREHQKWVQPTSLAGREHRRHGVTLTVTVTAWRNALEPSDDTANYVQRTLPTCTLITETLHLTLPVSDPVFMWLVLITLAPSSTMDRKIGRETLPCWASSVV
jgi:hypothetical protein